MSTPSRLCAAALLAASLGGCQSPGTNLLGKFMNGGGVMPDSEVGPPPSLRSAVPNARAHTASTVDEDGNPLPSSPTRQLALPKSAGGQTRTADEGARRINREDLAAGNGVPGRGSSANGMAPALSSSGGGMAPAMSPSGGMGMGGRF